MEAIPEKTEVKSDFELHYCTMHMCLVDVEYCKLKCRFAKTKSNVIDFHFGTDECCAKFPEEKYVEIRKDVDKMRGG